ncbi:MAG: acetylxylan esterase [Prolixibacteraceae bacterium]|jgi:dienelactone hydrolase
MERNQKIVKIGIIIAALKKAIFIGIFIAAPFLSYSQEKVNAIPDSEIWNLDELYRIPNTFSAEKYTEYKVSGVRALLYESVPFGGKPTKVFAYYSAPSGSIPQGGWPAVVLVHGGDGTAYANYVKMWNSWGYAAISMDLYGNLPLLSVKWKERPHLDGGWTMGENFTNRDESWQFHSIAQIVLAHSLLRSFPEVNPEKTGVVGTSWGGVHASVVAAIDSRFKFAVIVYSSVFETSETKMRWWDPGRFIASIRIPTLWVKGTTDIHFTNRNWQYSVNICGNSPISSLVVGLGHSDNGQIYSLNRRFADQIIKGVEPLPKVGKIERQGKRVSASVISARRIIKAELCYTCDVGPDPRQIWKTLPALFEDGKVSAELPDGVTFYFLNVFDEPVFSGEQEWPVSSEFIPYKSEKN